MELVDDGDRLVLTLSRSELLLLAGSVNEAIEAVDDWEFSTRLGVEKSEAHELGGRLRSIIASLSPTE